MFSDPVGHSMEFDLRVFSLAAVRKAAHRYAVCYDVQVECVAADCVRVTLVALGQATLPALSVDGFSAEVIEQDLRERVAIETKAVRDVILAQAFSGMNVLDPKGELGDSQGDSLEIHRSTSSKDNRVR